MVMEIEKEEEGNGEGVNKFIRIRKTGNVYLFIEDGRSSLILIGLRWFIRIRIESVK